MSYTQGESSWTTQEILSKAFVPLFWYSFVKLSFVNNLYSRWKNDMGTNLRVLDTNMYRSSRSQIFLKTGALKSFANLKGKHLHWSLFLIKVAGLKSSNFIKKRLQHRCFSVKFTNFSEHLFTSGGWLYLYISQN